MLWTLFAVGGFCYLCHRTRPSIASFQKFYQTYHQPKSLRGTTGRLLGAVEKLFSRGGGNHLNSAPTISVIDCLIVWLVRVEGEKEWHLGIFGVWIPLGGQSGRFSGIEEGKTFSSSTKSEESMVRVAKAEKLQKAAESLKAQSKYRDAAQKYNEAASELAQGGGDQWGMEGEMWEDAAKCWKMVGDEKAYIKCSIQAAQSFKSHNRSIRAATLYEKLAKHLLALRQSEKETISLEKSLEFYQMARDLYSIEDDARSKSLAMEILQIKAELGKYNQIVDEYITEAERIFRTDPILVNQSQRLLLMSVLACALLEDPIRLVGHCNRLLNQFSWFAASREGKWANSLADLMQSSGKLGEGQEEEIENHIGRLNHDLRIMATLPNWFYRGWEHIQASIRAAPVDLT